MAIPILKRAFATNVTSTATIACSVPSTTEPAGTAGRSVAYKLDQNFRDPTGKRKLFIKPFGTDAADEDFRLVVELFHVFREGQDAGNVSTIYIPTTAAILDCNLGASKAAGDIGSPKLLDADDRFANIIALAGGITTPNAEVQIQDSVAGDGDVPTKTSAVAMIETYGATHVMFHFSVDGTAATTAASANCLWTLI